MGFGWQMLWEMNHFFTVVRVLLGVFFVVFGLNYWFQFIPTPSPSGDAARFMGLLHGSSYLTVVKVLEVAGGLALLVQRTALGLLLLGPILVNLLLYDLLLVGEWNPVVLAASALAIILLVKERARFLPLLRAD